MLTLPTSRPGRPPSRHSSIGGGHCSGTDKRLGDGVGVDPEDLGVLAGFSGSPVHSWAAKTTVRKPLGAFTPQASWMMWATLRDSGFTVRPVSSIELADRSFSDGLARFASRAFGWASVYRVTVFPSSGESSGMLGKGFAGAAGEICGAGDTAAPADRERRADRGDRLPRAVGGHALHEDQGLGPGGDGFIGAGFSGEVVAEVCVGEGVDALVLLRVPAGEGVLVLLLGADVVGEVGQGAGGVTRHGASGGAEVDEAA